MLLLHQKKIFWLSLFQSIGITKPRSQMTGITLIWTQFWYREMQTCTHGHNTPSTLLGWALSTPCQYILTLHNSEHDMLHTESSSKQKVSTKKESKLFMKQSNLRETSQGQHKHGNSFQLCEWPKRLWSKINLCHGQRGARNLNQQQPGLTEKEIHIAALTCEIKFPSVQKQSRVRNGEPAPAKAQPWEASHWS